MPQLSDLIQKRKFVKKEYRPWDLSGSGSIDDKESDKNIVKSVETQNLVEKTTPVTASKSDTAEKNSTNQINASKIILPKTDQLIGNDTGNSLGNKQVTTKQQIVNNKITKDNDSNNNQIPTREHPSNEINNITGNANNLAYLIESIKKLAGIQKNIFYYVINICSARGVLDTGNILSNDLALAAGCSVGSAKTSLIRLIEKKLILRLQGKASRGGHIALGITKEIQAASIQAQQAWFNPLKIPTTDNITGNNISNFHPYSSSNNKNITTTALSEEWKKINFETLQHIGFSETQLRQLFDSKMTDPEIVQDSINKFAFGLEHNEKTKGYPDPLNILMGVLRKGNRWNETNYISPKDMALRQLVEEKRKQKEQREAIINELIKLEFPEWERKLTEEQIKQIVPPDSLRINTTAAISNALKEYFVNNILKPKIETEIE